MKKLFLLLFLLASLADAHAQGTLEFTTHLTSPQTDVIGDGSFSLTGNLFNYDVQVHYGLEIAEIQGPGPATNAPVIFSLHLRRCEAPAPGVPGKCYFQGNFTLSGSQITELVSDQWYVSAFSGSTPPVVLRGQILQVPEPSSLTLIAFGIAFAYLCCKRRSTRGSSD